MEVFTLCDCDNITNSYVAHYEQKTNRSRNQKKIVQCERALTEQIAYLFACGKHLDSNLPCDSLPSYFWYQR